MMNNGRRSATSVELTVTDAFEDRTWTFAGQ
jgi:hypothetical protein